MYGIYRQYLIEAEKREEKRRKMREKIGTCIVCVAMAALWMVAWAIR